MPERLQDVWHAYQRYTEDTSRVARPLGFAAAGLAWVFRTEAGLPPEALKSLLFTVAFFATDLLQYYIGAAVTYVWARSQEVAAWKASRTIDVEVERPRWLDAPARILFHVKIVSLAVAFLWLFPLVI